MDNTNINKEPKSPLKPHTNSIVDINSAILGTSKQDPPTHGPRRELFQQHRTSVTIPARKDASAEGEFGDHHVAKLVITDQRKSNHLARSDAAFREAHHKRTSFNDTPIEFTADEGVGSPTNIDYEDEDGPADEYYDDEEDFETTEQTDELTNLSRQSMMPLHELIAYYQYIQQGNDQHYKYSVSRQSSSASQTTTRTKYSYNEDVTDCQQQQQPQTAEEVIEKETVSTQVTELEAKNEHLGQIPKVNVERVESVDHNDNSKQSIPSQLPPTKDKRRIRANVVLELINSERDFVKHLKDVVEGYLYPARRHPEIFTGERINTIFSNIEQLYEFQRAFLDSLEPCIDWDDLASSEVGNCFLQYESGFSVYHHYCNNHPNATSELQDLYTKPRFVKFFEACRLLQNMIDISLDGFLLTPIQKICKYPLQLNELLKNTEKDHPDFLPVASALESMRNCANLANERKRRIEALADIMSFQEKVENWFGPKLSDTSSILIHSGEVSKMTSHTWSQGVQLYLFDHLLLYSKKDLLKRNALILKGRICMDTVTEISDADEYKAKKSFKLYCSEQQKWFVFTTKSEKEKEEWIRAFERERNLVEADENEGFLITEREIGVARKALQNRKHSRSARYRHKRPDTAVVDQLDIDDANTIMNRTLSLPSCIHPSHVMNFVEDSRVVSNRSKKNPSPNASSRSPNSSHHQINEQENQQQSTGSWFKKMGSKKLARSQVYNVNGAGAVNSVTSPTNLAASVASDMTATAKYDQLEKRHRDHMVSEEQARLFRLNNDIPSPIFASAKSSVAAPSLDRQRAQTQSQQQPHNHSLNRVSNNDNNPIGLNFRSLNLSQEPSNLVAVASESSDNSTFETMVVLASGKVVKVREDAV